MAKQHDDEPILQRVGTNLRAWRLRQGLTRDALGERIGTDGKNLYRLEKGTENLTLVRAQRIADALGLRLEDLIAEPTRSGWTGDMEALGLRVVSPSMLDHPSLVPVYDLQPCEDREQVTPSPKLLGRVRGLSSLGSGSELFVARIAGSTMQPRIQSATWHLFSNKIPLGDLLGAIILIGERESSGVWMRPVKRVEQVTLLDDETRQVTVRGTGTGQMPRSFRLSSEDMRIVGVWRGALTMDR